MLVKTQLPKLDAQTACLVTGAVACCSRWTHDNVFVGSSAQPSLFSFGGNCPVMTRAPVHRGLCRDRWNHRDPHPYSVWASLLRRDGGGPYDATDLEWRSGACFASWRSCLSCRSRHRFEPCSALSKFGEALYFAVPEYTDGILKLRGRRVEFLTNFEVTMNSFASTILGLRSGFSIEICRGKMIWFYQG